MPTATSHRADTTSTATTSPVFVATFGCGPTPADAPTGRALLGGKGNELAEMSRLGLPVPPGCTVTTDACRWYMEHDYTLPPELEAQLQAAVASMEATTGRTFGRGPAPLLVSVRSGAPISMPGMMDTVLNLGLTQDVLAALREERGTIFALDCERRFMSMYGDVVLGMADSDFESPAHPLTEDALRAAIVQHSRAIHEAGHTIPADPFDQLRAAIGCVMESWVGDRAISYRQHTGIPDSLGTAVNIQSMVFGNAGERSASGVLFTRNPSTGEPGMFGEFLVNAQGEDVVSGERTPLPIDDLRTDFPKVHADLTTACANLEAHYRDMQDIEFTVEEDTLYILQTRRGQRTPAAALRIATELLDAGIISETEAVQRIPAGAIPSMAMPTFKTTPAAGPDATGIGAAPGAAIGRVALTAHAAHELSSRDMPTILVRQQTSAADIDGIIAAGAVLTQHGGATSHAAVVTRGMGTPCVVGCGALDVDEHAGTLSIGGTVVREGDVISIDGTTGAVYATQLELVPAPSNSALDRLLDVAMGEKQIGVHANADLPADARTSVEQGAEGIGLCRTEHMFFAVDRLPHFVASIMAADEQARAGHLDALLEMQRADFEAMLTAMDGKTVTVRLLDPPLHEFLPSSDEDQHALAAQLGITVDAVVSRVHELAETNPMLGHRGVRLGLTDAAISRMQVRAIVQATIAARGAGVDARPAIMIPLVSLVGEVTGMVDIIRAVIDEELAEAGAGLSAADRDAVHAIPIGTMMETPRACVVAATIAPLVDFMSFGTNDLTQMTFGMSRDDSASVIDFYRKSSVLDRDPFSTVDEDGVGALMRMAITAARDAHPGIDIGVCGEHGGDPASIAFFASIPVDYVSCSPRRIHVAQMAAAQAALATE